MAGRLRTIGLAVVWLLAAALGESFGQAPEAPPKPVAPPAPVSVPPAEVATRSTEVTNLLGALATEFAPSPEIEKIRSAFYQVSGQIEREYYEALAAIETRPTLAGLQAQQVLWKPRQLQLSGWLTLLTKRAVELRKVLNRMDDLRATWTRTRLDAQASQAPPATLQQIAAVLNAIAAAQAPLRVQHDELLSLQSLVSEELTRCDDILARIAQAQKTAVSGILAREGQAVWSAEQWKHAKAALPEQLRSTYSAFRAEAAQYLGDPSREMPLQLGLCVLLAGLFAAARRLERRRQARGEAASAVLSVFTRPFSAALFTAWFVATRYASPTPQMVKELLTGLAIVPILRLVQPAIPPVLMPAVRVLAALYALDIVREILVGAAGVEQALLLLEAAAGVAAIGWLLSSGHLRRAFAENPRRQRAVEVAGRVAMLFLAGGVLAAALGHLRLARVVTPGFVSSAMLALSLYAGVRVFGGTVGALLRLWPLRLMQMVRQHRDRLEKKAYRLLGWLAFIGWATRSLDHVGLLDPIFSTGSAILAIKLERGSLSISIEDILAFGVTIWAAFLLSRFVRFALEEEVYPRARVPSGTAYASSRLLHYVVLSLGFAVGLAVLGMDLTRLSVMAGAFGVGIGFGLQSVVNNFVCGLILLFERPIHVGDVIEVGELLGEVRRIGFRASTVRTRRGADIIIPNAEFITANVTNWTLSDRLRRIDLPVGVSYASAPKEVIDLLEGVARANGQVLKYPAPLCLFMGYGDSSINFELRAWTDRYADYAQVRSDLNSAIYDAVKAAGMSFPFPQREVRLLGDPGARPSDHLGPEPDAGPSRR